MIKFEISGRHITDIQEFLKSVPRGVKGVAVTAVREYIMGNSRHGLKHEPAYKYVSRKSAYGKTFFSDKQRKWFWANGGPDMIGNHRTGYQTSSWGYTGDPTTRQTIYNTAASTAYTMGDKSQAAQPRLVGWRKVGDVVRSNLQGAFRSATLAINRWFKEHGN